MVRRYRRRARPRPLLVCAAAAAPVSDVKAGCVSDVKVGGGPSVRLHLANGIDYPLTAIAAEKLMLELYGIARWDAHRPDIDAASAQLMKEVDALSTFGEILPAGVALACDGQHLRATSAKRVLEFGAGQGKLAFQVNPSIRKSLDPVVSKFDRDFVIMEAFLCYHEIENIVGVEMILSRLKLGIDALKALAEKMPTVFKFDKTESGARLTMVQTGDAAIKSRVLELHDADMFTFAAKVPEAEILICECELSLSKRAALARVLCSMKPGGRFLLYHGVSDLPSYAPDSQTSGHFYLTAIDGSKHRFSRIHPGDGYAVTWGKGQLCYFDLATKCE